MKATSVPFLCRSGWIPSERSSGRSKEEQTGTMESRNCRWPAVRQPHSPLAPPRRGEFKSVSLTSPKVDDHWGGQQEYQNED